MKPIAAMPHRLVGLPTKFSCRRCALKERLLGFENGGTNSRRWIQNKAPLQETKRRRCRKLPSSGAIKHQRRCCCSGAIETLSARVSDAFPEGLPTRRLNMDVVVAAIHGRMPGRLDHHHPPPPLYAGVHLISLSLHTSYFPSPGFIGLD